MATIKKKSNISYAISKLLKLFAATVLFSAIICGIIALGVTVSFRNTSEKGENFSVALLTKRGGNSVKLDKSLTSVNGSPYFPLGALKGYVDYVTVGSSESLIISDPDMGTSITVQDNSSSIKVNGIYLRLENPVIMYGDECLLPLDLIQNHTCLSVSYDEKACQYTVSCAEISFICFSPGKNSSSESCQYNISTTDDEESSEEFSDEMTNGE